MAGHGPLQVRLTAWAHDTPPARDLDTGLPHITYVKRDGCPIAVLEAT